MPAHRCFRKRVRSGVIAARRTKAAGVLHRVRVCLAAAWRAPRGPAGGGSARGAARSLTSVRPLSCPQARALTPQTAETDAIRFLVGTQSLKYDNQVTVSAGACAFIAETALSFPAV